MNKNQSMSSLPSWQGLVAQQLPLLYIVEISQSTIVSTINLTKFLTYMKSFQAPKSLCDSKTWS